MAPARRLSPRDRGGRGLGLSVEGGVVQTGRVNTGPINGEGVPVSGEGVRTGRNETAEERIDRKWEDLLQELRVMQTGAQLTAGFLLTLPFQSAFAELSDFQTNLYLILVVLAGLTTALVIAPVAVHRRLSGKHVKGRVLAIAERLVRGVLLAISLLITGMSWFIFDVVSGGLMAMVVGVLMATVLTTLLLILPSTLLKD